MNMQLCVGFITLDSSSDRHKYLQIICIALQFINMCCPSHLSPLQAIPSPRLYKSHLSLDACALGQCASAPVPRVACNETLLRIGIGLCRTVGWLGQHPDSYNAESVEGSTPKATHGKAYDVTYAFDTFQTVNSLRAFVTRVLKSLCLCGSVGVCVCVWVNALGSKWAWLA